MAKTDDKAPSGVKAKLLAHKHANSGTDSFALPVTGIDVTFPKFRPHGLIMRAGRIAGQDVQKLQAVYVVQNCRFDGEKLTLADFEDLVPDDDSAALIKRLFATDDDADDVGADGDTVGEGTPAMEGVPAGEARPS
jgi:hypothetical protein